MSWREEEEEEDSGCGGRAVHGSEHSFPAGSSKDPIERQSSKGCGRERKREAVRDRDRGREGGIACAMLNFMCWLAGMDFQEHKRPSVPLHKVVPLNGIVN